VNEPAGALTTGVPLTRISQATVRLVTGAFAVLHTDPSIGRAEALRRAEMAMLDFDRPPEFSHALFSAPFHVSARDGVPGSQWMASSGRLGMVAGCLLRCRKSRLDSA